MTELAIVAVCFSLIIVSILIAFYEQVKRNRQDIDFLLEQHMRDIVERRRAERIREWIENASGNQTRRHMHGS